MKTYFAAAILIAMTTSASIANEAPNSLPVAATRLYDPVSRNTDFLMGDMHLSKEFVSFSALNGRAALQYSGTMPDPEFQSRTATVYRVTNADEYYQMNKGKNGFCDRPVKWIGITPLGGSSVRISFLTTRDFHLWTDPDYTYTPHHDSLGLCSAHTYSLHGSD